MRLYNIAVFIVFLLTTIVNTPEKEVLHYEDTISTNEVIELQKEVIEEEIIEEDIIIEEEIIEEEIIEAPVEQPVIEIIKFNENGLMLREGILNEEVLRIKRFLKAKGYTDITEGSYFDSKTKELIIKYQSSNYLDSNGIIGPFTFEKINEDMELNQISIPKIEMVFSTEVPVEKWIIINKSNNTLYHLNGSEIIKSYPVATGKGPEYTPEGKFTIVTKLINPAWGGAGRYTPVKGGAPNNPLGKRWMGLSIKGGGTYGIHGNADFGSIGKYTSLGCIRMFNDDVEILYDLIQKGTPVWIGSETKFIEYGVTFH